MSWERVGDWLKQNAGAGAALVGGLLTGNVPAAVAAGVALVSSATGESDPTKVLTQLQTDPATVLKLRELALQDEASIREHIRAMTQMQLESEAKFHQQTQETIRSGDTAEDPFVRRTRPAQSWVSLFAALAYALGTETPNIEIAIMLFALPWAYAGLRQVGKGLDAVVAARGNKGRP